MNQSDDTPPEESPPPGSGAGFLDTEALISVGELPAADRRELEAALDRVEELPRKAAP